MKRKKKRKVWAAGKHGPVTWIKWPGMKNPPQEEVKELDPLQQQHMREILEGANVRQVLDALPEAVSKEGR